jgi:hypothetical protein
MNLDTPNGLPFTVTRKVAAPKAIGGGLYLWFLSIQFPDGMRSAVSLGRPKMPAAGSPGWHAVLTVPDSKGGLAAGTPTAAHFDQKMAAGDVLYWFMADSDQNYARGLWSRDASQCSALEINAFAWGTSQLANTMQAQTGPVSTTSPPAAVVVTARSSGNATPVRVQPTPIVVAPVPERRWPYYVGTLVVVGVVGWMLLD